MSQYSILLYICLFMIYQDRNPDRVPDDDDTQQ